MTASWRWMALGPNGRILHLVEAWKSTTAREARYDTACGEPGGAPVPTLIEEGGESRCIRCLRRVLAAPQ